MLTSDQNQQAVTWGAAFLLGISLGRLIGSWRARCREPRVNGAAANAGKARAAARAVETLEAEEGRLFADELAVALSGQAAFASALKAAQPWPQGPGRRLYTIAPLAAATWWVDRALLTALTTPAIPPTKGWLSARLSLSARGPSAPPRHVVLLGAGMDTRAWRLPLPPGIKWFEVDRGEVLTAKRRSLAHSGAEVPGEGHGPPQHQLRSESWAAVAADLKQPKEMVDTLLAAGFDLEGPTVWVAEGALEFLEGGEAAALLTAAVGASAQGSTLVGHALTEEGLAALEAAGWTPQTTALLEEVGAQACSGQAGGFAASPAGGRSEAFFTAKIQ
jgi:O-methyltransferase involved in polyketide biosynthesis